MSKLLIICGISFAGKTTLGKAIAARFGYAEVDVDETKVHLFGPDIQDHDLSHPDWVRIYAETDNLIERYLLAGQTVVDASRNFKKAEHQAARAIADKARAEFVIIFVDTPAAIARQRLLENRVKQTRVDFSDEEFEELLQVTEPPTADENSLVFRYGDQLDAWISEHLGGES